MKNSNLKKIYVSYSTRLIINICFCIVFLLFSIFFLYKFMNINNYEKINYQESSNLDYKVYLKQNNFYEEKYLNKDRIYIASLIDNIVIDYNYLFNIDENSNIDFSYDVIAKLSIDDETSSNTYFEKEYVLVDNKKGSIKDNKEFKFNEEVIIDYDYYNGLASQFRQTYGLDAISNLKVYLLINKSDSNKLNDSSIMSVDIPLTEKAINIKMDYKDINKNSYLINTNQSIVKKIVLIISFIVSLLLMLVNVVGIVKLLSLYGNRKSLYDKYVDKILREYDRVIVESTTSVKLNDKNVIKIKNFEELLDVRDNLKLPIIYYSIVNHHKCYFYVKHEKDIYLMVVKASDLEAVNHE